MRLKIFQCEVAENLERQVNEWLTEHENAHVYDIKQSESGGEDWGMITLSILYDPPRPATEEIPF